MAELVFEKLYTDSSTSLSDVCIGNEPDNTITKFFIEAHRQGNTLGDVTLSNYDNVNWRQSNGLMTSQSVVDIGIKTFPQIGAIGFYKLKYENRSLVLAPIYTKSKRYDAPLITVEDQSGTLLVTLKSPENVTYECYRIVVRNGYFAEEYVTYEPEVVIPTPTSSGIYSVTAFGYLNEQLASKESEIQHIAVAGESDSLDEVAFLACEDGCVLILGDTGLAL